MECQELRQEIGEWRRDRLPSDRARDLERHLSACPECQQWEQGDRVVNRLLAERLPRYAAPVHLKRQIRETVASHPRPSRWWIPAAAAVATALLMVLLLLPALPRPIPPDPLQPIVRAALSQHERSLLWGEPHPEAVPGALPRLTKETGIGLSRVFMGTDEIRLFGAEPVIVQGRRGLAFFYRDPGDHLITYLVLPGQGLSVPDRNRVQIDRFRPMLDRINSFSVFLWKQGDLACFLISDLVSEGDLRRFREYFLRIRLATEPFPIR